MADPGFVEGEGWGSFFRIVKCLTPDHDHGR
jgi:hypothetical protein